ncbi:MAG: lipocalin family protein [Candidatus Cloacimonadaceae bacterium]
MRFIIILIILLTAVVSSLAARKLPPLTTVDKVDLQRYAGLWYQIAYFPFRFQPKDAKLTTAEYALHPKGYITVKNTAYKDFNGTQKMSEIDGKAFIADKKTNAKLKVQFFWPFKGDYWIILLDKEKYDWAVVSAPNRKYLWILSRQPEMEKDLYDSLVRQIAAKHIDTDKIVLTGRLN